MNGRSQAVRIPSEFRFQENEEILICKVGNMIVLKPKNSDPWGDFIEALDGFGEDFLQDRKQPKVQKRKNL